MAESPSAAGSTWVADGGAGPSMVVAAHSTPRLPGDAEMMQVIRAQWWVGDVEAAVPLGIAFLLRSAKAERVAWFFVVAAILSSVATTAGDNLLDEPQGRGRLEPSDRLRPDARDHRRNGVIDTLVCAFEIASGETLIQDNVER